MSKKLARAAAVAATMLLGACSAGGWWPFGDASAPEPNRVPPGATEYACAEGKRLLVRYAPDGKSAWVIYPDREFRLDRVPSGSGVQYSNGSTRLSTQGDEALLEADGARAFGDCRRKSGG